MKRIFFLMLLLSGKFLNAQEFCENYCLSFDDTICLDRLSTDTSGYPQNVWQIGRPGKLTINNTSYPSRVIVTDTMNPYPVNNHSVFTLTNVASMGDVYGCKMFQGTYYSETDSLNDYGRMEFSPDNGTTWIDLLNDTIYNASITWWGSKPVFTGHSRTCKYFEMLFADNGSVFNIELGDTLIYRFTFSSDSIFDNAGGLMFDDLCFWEFVEGLSEVHFKPIKSKLYPNPVMDQTTIMFENPNAETFQLAVYDIHSKLVLTIENIAENTIIFTTKSFKPGVYMYKLTNLKNKKRSWGKFIKAG